MNTKLTNFIIIGAIIILIGGAAYYYLTKEPVVDEALTSAPTEAAKVDGDLITALYALQRLKFDRAVYDHPVYGSLEDFGKELEPEPRSRSNPFAPFTGEAQ